MRDFKGKVRKEILEGQGMLNAGVLLNPNFLAMMRSLDAAVRTLAARVLKGQPKVVFLLLYHCRPTHDSVADDLNRLYGDWSVENVKRYGRAAKATLIAEAITADEIIQWKNGLIEWTTPNS